MNRSQIVSNPFLTETTQPLVAIQGKRCGYVQLAPSKVITTYQDLPEALFIAAKTWAAVLEDLGAKRVYWITLSEMVPHLHIHLYPRWSDKEERGISLFEQRNDHAQPLWTPDIQEAFTCWLQEHQIHLIAED